MNEYNMKCNKQHWKYFEVKTSKRMVQGHRYE